jgi:hypothetical protein
MPLHMLTQTFSGFTLPFVKGDQKTALLQPNMRSFRELCTKYFGKEDPIGKVLVLKDWNNSFDDGLMRTCLSILISF